MASLPRDPLNGTDRLLVDGTNLLHAISRRPGAAPHAALIGVLRAIVPANVGIELVFDGTPDPGMRGQRVASGLLVRHGGRRSADELLVSLVDETRQAAGPEATAGLLIVSDDHGLRAALRARGARTAGTDWLIGRMERPRLAGPSIGNKRPPTASHRPPTAGQRPQTGSGRPPTAGSRRHGQARQSASRSAVLR
ncbi:MAG: hypothetical protein WKF56_08565 [Candidatus Limnocylindrales bacterium]